VPPVAVAEMLPSAAPKHCTSCNFVALTDNAAAGSVTSIFSVLVQLRLSVMVKL